jgi:hypothetical protein
MKDKVASVSNFHAIRLCRGRGDKLACILDSAQREVRLMAALLSDNNLLVSIICEAVRTSQRKDRINSCFDGNRSPDVVFFCSFYYSFSFSDDMSNHRFLKKKGEPAFVALITEGKKENGIKLAQKYLISALGGL